MLGIQHQAGHTVVARSDRPRRGTTTPCSPSSVKHISVVHWRTGLERLVSRFSVSETASGVRRSVLAGQEPLRLRVHP
jgi:hypothetical protein